MIEKAISALNEAFRNNPEAVAKIFRFRVKCNTALAEHPTIQVGGEKEGEWDVGPLGFINGAIEPMTGERIAVIIGDNGEFCGFTKYKGVRASKIE